MQQHSQLSAHLIIFGCDEFIRTDDVLDFIIVFAKFYIYKCKMNGDLPSLEVFIHLLRNRYEIERFVAFTQMYGERFHEMWQLYLTLF